MTAAIYQAPTVENHDDFVREMIPYVKYLAHRISVRLPPSVDVEDLVQYGVLGLLDACEKYDAGRGVKFKTYAETRIRGAMLDGLRSSDWVPRSVRKKRRDLESALSLVEQSHGRPGEDEEVAEAMGLKLSEFQSLISDVQGLALGSLEELLFNGEDRGLLLRYGADVGEDDGPYANVERKQMREILAASIDHLPEKERTILSLYYYEEMSMKEIGTILGISESRVSQLHTKAVLRIRAKLAHGLQIRRVAA